MDLTFTSLLKIREDMLRKATYSGKATELISKVAITQNVFSGIN